MLTLFYNERHKMELSSKTRKQFVFVDTYRCFCDMSIVIWISIWARIVCFLFVCLFFYVIAKKAKLSTNKGAGWWFIRWTALSNAWQAGAWLWVGLHTRVGGHDVSFFKELRFFAGSCTTNELLFRERLQTVIFKHTSVLENFCVDAMRKNAY